MKCRTILELLAILFFTGYYNREQISRLDEAEALLQNKSDSAFTILQQLKPEGRQADQVRYALLYFEALDKNHTKVTNDLLIRQAWNHYKHHPQDLHRQCKTLYYWGRIKLRTGDKPGALRFFLEIEGKLEDTNEPYYTGLSYSQVGEVYCEQMSYNRAYHYFREARNNLRQSNSVREETEATLDIAVATFHSRDIEKAMRPYSTALDLVDELKNDHLTQTSLTNLASPYVVLGKRQIPHDLLQRIEFSARRDILYGCHTLVDANLIKNRLDSARHYLTLIEVNTTDIHDMAELQYTAYRIEAQAKNFKQATDNIHRYIHLTDSLTRSNMQFSASMVEREYFKEQSGFTEYRMKNRIIWEIVIAAIVSLIIGMAYYITRQHLCLQRKRIDHYLLLAEETNSEYKTLIEHLEGQRNAESHLKGLIASRFGIIDRLGKTYYERKNTISQQAAMFHEVEQIITSFAENNEMLQELKLIVNTCHDNAMEKLRNDFPTMRKADTQLLCYILVGFSPQVISLFMKDMVVNVYARKPRLKSCIKSAETINKDLFLALFGQVLNQC